ERAWPSGGPAGARARESAHGGRPPGERIPKDPGVGVCGMSPDSMGCGERSLRQMTQDTRKDKRAKIVSLNVRYKSATVDEFIENHSHDISKGGIFVKTPNPFAPGTLLKFEIRLAGDRSVISGVGRVVGKREPTQAGSERPAGMGVKFIK